MKKHFVDTNYFLRFLLKDNKIQFEKVYSLFQEAINQKVKLVTSIIVIFEIYWVLSSFYKDEKEKCADKLKKILRLEFVEIEEREIAKEAINLFLSTSLDLEDCYNISFAKNKKAADFASFDQKATQIFQKRLKAG